MRARGIEPACDVAAERGNAFDEIAAVCQARGGDCEAPLRETLQRWIERVAGRTVPDLGHWSVHSSSSKSTASSGPARPTPSWWSGLQRSVPAAGELSSAWTCISEASSCFACFRPAVAPTCLMPLCVRGRGSHQGQRPPVRACLTARRHRIRRIVHVGDSLAADGHGAAREHIRAIVVRDRDRRRRSAVALSDRIAYRESTDWAGIVIAAYADPGLPAFTVEESVGRTVIRPAVAAAAHSIADQCRARGVRHVYFLSREGLLLKAAFDRLRPQVWRSGGAPRASYACLSRFTTLLAATRGLGPYELSAALTNHPFRRCSAYWHRSAFLRTSSNAAAGAAASRPATRPCRPGFGTGRRFCVCSIAPR